MLNFAIQTARDAGRVLAEKFGRAIQITNKGDIDLVTEADLAAERLIVERIRSYHPRHSRTFIMSAQSARRDGAAALDLAYVASGRFDGFYEEGLRPWDVAAGVLLVEEAGGRVTHYDGRPFHIYTPPIAASNGLVHDAMLEVLQQP